MKFKIKNATEHNLLTQWNKMLYIGIPSKNRERIEPENRYTCPSCGHSWLRFLGILWCMMYDLHHVAIDNEGIDGNERRFQWFDEEFSD